MSENKEQPVPPRPGRRQPKQPRVLPNGNRRKLSIQEVADDNGLSVYTVAGHIRQGRLKAFQPSRGITRIDPRAVEDWLAGK